MAESTGRTALAAAVGLVLADSSIVVLALPEIYRELDVSVTAVVWVLIAFNLVLALAAVPAAHAAGTIGPARLTAAGLVLFSAASLACGLAPSIEVLLAARCVQAIGGAAAVCAALELMPATYGSERRAARAWAAAGATGAALGPGVGGLLTELISWESIFLVQVPAALAFAVPLIAAARGEQRAARAPGSVRPHLAANAALALVSAALAAALFLVVLLLIEGWRLTPIAAAAAVSVLPVCSLLAAPLARRVAAVDARAAAGVILIAGGLAGLGLLPKASVMLKIPPQALVGWAHAHPVRPHRGGARRPCAAGDPRRLDDRRPSCGRGGRAAGADADLHRRPRERARRCRGRRHRGAARLAPVARRQARPRGADRRPDRARGRQGPVLGPAFEPLPDDPQQRAETISLRTSIEDEVDRAATRLQRLVSDRGRLCPRGADPDRDRP